MLNKYICIVAAALLVTLSFGSSALIASGHGTAASQASDMAGKAAGMMDKLNVNTASIESLAKIPGLDQKISEAIAAYREANGAFKSLSELANIEGIDAGLLDKIKPFLTI